MQVKDNFFPQPLTREVMREWIGRDGVRHTEEERILREHSVCISASDGYTAWLTCLPEHLAELALGHLLTEGWITSAAEISEVSVSENGEEIAVLLADGQTGGERYGIARRAYR